MATLLACLAGGPATAADVAVTASVAVDVDGTHYEANGPAECRAAADASIYDVPASMWHASFVAAKNPLSRVNATIWVPTRGGSPQVTLLVAAGPGTHEIVTVPARASGSGQGRFESQGAGGRLIVEGVTASRRRVRVSISCSRFLPAEDNG